MKKKQTEYIIEMRDAAYVLQDAGQSSQFRDCPVVTLAGVPQENHFRDMFLNVTHIILHACTQF